MSTKPLHFSHHVDIGGPAAVHVLLPCSCDLSALAGLAQLHGDVARVKASKTGVTCIIPLVDDDVFQPAALLRAYAGTDPKLCLPRINYPYLYLPHVQALAGIERVPVKYHLGRKTFATLNVA